MVRSNGCRETLRLRSKGYRCRNTGRSADALDERKSSSYNSFMRRKPGSLLPIEVAILRAGLDLRGVGDGRFHGYLVASKLREHENARTLTAHGTLYKALDRMQKSGLLTSEWEDPLIAAEEQRPRRRLYAISAAGERAVIDAERAMASARATLEKGLQPS